jgi:hypothetical protein
LQQSLTALSQIPSRFTGQAILRDDKPPVFTDLIHLLNRSASYTTGKTAIKNILACHPDEGGTFELRQEERMQPVLLPATAVHSVNTDPFPPSPLPGNTLGMINNHSLPASINS